MRRRSRRRKIRFAHEARWLRQVTFSVLRFRSPPFDPSNLEILRIRRKNFGEPSPPGFVNTSSILFSIYPSIVFGCTNVEFCYQNSILHGFRDQHDDPHVISAFCHFHYSCTISKYFRKRKTTLQNSLKFHDWIQYY